MALVDEIREALNLSHAHAWSRATTIPPGPDEPGLVSSFLSSTTQNELRRILGSHFGAGISMQLSSVFTHKTPTVEPAGALNSVEIGDLLLIRQHFAKGRGTPATAGRALLLQAKRNSKPDSGNISTGNPKIQFELYRDWPPFKGDSHLKVGPDGVSGSYWDFESGMTKGLRYGDYLAVYDGLAFDFFAGPPPLCTANAKSALLPSGYPPSASPSTWANGQVSKTALATYPVPCNFDFAATLADFVKGSAGISFTPGGAGTDHWSIFIDRMLQVAGKTRYTYTSKSTGVPRGTRRLADINFWSALPFLSLGLNEEPAEYLYDHSRKIPYKVMRSRRQDSFLGDLARWVVESESLDGDGEDPPRQDRFDGDGDEGHVPALILATYGSDMPQEFLDGAM